LHPHLPSENWTENFAVVGNSAIFINAGKSCTLRTGKIFLHGTFIKNKVMILNMGNDWELEILGLIFNFELVICNIFTC
jgi:hypothetical protein